MQINLSFPLIIRDLNVYDIESCHYNILKSMNYDLGNIDENNKEERNIAIGKLMRDNPKLTPILRTTTESIIDELISRNNLKEDDIVLRQYDGLMTQKYLRDIDFGNIPLSLRKTFEVFISSYNRNMYIAKDGSGNVSIKGVPSRYDAMDLIYRKILQISFHNKQIIFKSLHKIKTFFDTTDNVKIFAIPKGDAYRIYVRGFGEIEVTKPTLNLMDASDIQRDIYFKNYIQPFTKSIVIENVR